MEYWDPIFHDVTIKEPVLVALIESSAMRRLQGVLQHGITGLLGITSPITRFEHSMGVMLLVRQLGGDLEEQIAGLLHDVSHSAFSHVIDHVFDTPGSQSYHEHIRDEFLLGTDVPSILAGYGYQWRMFLDDSRFPLLEQPSPALCADRIDYALRDALELDLLTSFQVAEILSHLCVHDRRIVMDHVDIAQTFAEVYMAADDASWSDFREVGLYEVTAQAIKRGLKIGAIGEADLWSTDENVWRLLNQTADQELQRRLAMISVNTRFLRDDANPSFTLRTKIRTIDPDIWQDDRVQLLSTLAPAYGAARCAYLARKDGAWPMRVIPPEAEM